MAEDRTRIVAGCMTGTSLDGLDIALVKITGTGLDMKAELLGHHALSMPDGLRATLMSLASGEANEPIVYMRAARALGELHADGIEQLLAGGLVPPITPGAIAPGENASGEIDFVTAHGQTIWHAPRPRNYEDASHDDLGPMSWQLFDPWPIVRRLKRPVCYDLRQADLIAGGEGAPLTPIADWVMYREHAEVVFNLGGICNATWLRGPDPQRIRGFDLFPCNLILNQIAEQMLGVPYDKDGECARSGQARRSLVKAIQSFAMPAAELTHSQGRETVPKDWLDRVIAADPQVSSNDVLASAIEVIRYLVGAFVMGIEESDLAMVFAGGGARNLALIKRLEDELAALGSVTISDSLGISCEAREAMGFAVLGALSQDGVPISLPQVTGAEDPGVAGVWAYP